MPNEHRADPTPSPHLGQDRGGSKKESFSLRVSPALHPPERPSPRRADMADHGLGRETQERSIFMRRYSSAISNTVEESLCCIKVGSFKVGGPCELGELKRLLVKCVNSLLDKAYGRNRSSWSAVRVDAGKHVDFCRGFVMSTAERSRVTNLRQTRHTGVLLFHRAMSVRDGKARSRAILVFFGLDPAPPSFQHARPPKRC